MRDRFPRYLDEVVPFPGFPGLPERSPDLAALPPFLCRLQRGKFDLALQLHGSGALVNNICVLFGARRTAGFCEPAGYCPDPELFHPYPEHETEVRRGLRLLENLGLPTLGEELELPIREHERDAATRLLREGGIPTDAYACIHPGARAASRRWAPQRFGEVAARLHASGLAVVLTGSADVARLAGEVAHAAGVPVWTTAGRADLGAMAALIAGARILVSNDTMVSHVAAAVRTPSVVVTLGSDPARWAPADRVLHRPVFEDVPCRPCAGETCPIGHPCSENLQAGRVADVAVDLLRATEPVELRRRA
jgi:ADP-heptose:LPS heptosyltransferase